MYSPARSHVAVANLLDEEALLNQCMNQSSAYKLEYTLYSTAQTRERKAICGYLITDMDPRLILVGHGGACTVQGVCSMAYRLLSSDHVRAMTKNEK